jgi:hypothetical protein
VDALTVRFRHRGVLASRATRPCCRSPQQRDEGPPSVVTFFLRGRPPLLLAGPGIRRGRFAARLNARDVSASLAFALGVPPPDACVGTPVSALGAR